MNATIVSAFFDINRETLGDGRKLEEYKEWIKRTLQLNCNLYIITEARFIDFMISHRPSEYHHKTVFNVDTLENAMFYKYREQMCKIMQSEEYKRRIMHPDRVECKLPEYNIIQYSKFGWLLDAIQENPFQSDVFFWMDIGISRFFESMDLTREYPNPLALEQMRLANNNLDGFIIQKRYDLETFKIDDEFVWRSDNLLKGTLFGGSIECIKKITNAVENIFQKDMLNKGCVNNEQIALALLYKQYPDWFYLTKDSSIRHLELIFELL